MRKLTKREKKRYRKFARQARKLLKETVDDDTEFDDYFEQNFKEVEPGIYIFIGKEEPETTTDWRTYEAVPCDDCDNEWAIYDAIYMAKIEALEREKYARRYTAPMFGLDLVDEDGEYFPL